MSRWLLLVLGIMLSWTVKANPLLWELAPQMNAFDVASQARLLQTEMLQRMGARSQEHELLGFEQHLLNTDQPESKTLVNADDNSAWLGAVRKQMAVVPEPATLALLAFGVTGLVLTRRRRTI